MGERRVQPVRLREPQSLLAAGSARDRAGQLAGGRGQTARLRRVSVRRGKRR